MNTYGPSGFQYIEMLSDGSQSTNQSWMNNFGMTNVAVLADTSNTWYPYEADGGIVSVTFIGPDMKIITVDTGSRDPGSYL